MDVKKSISVIAGLILAFSMCGTALAKKHHNNNGSAPSNSQAGGLPALAAKVDTLETSVSALQTAVTTLQNQVIRIGAAINKLDNQVKDLQGQNNWVVVGIGASGPTITRQSSNLGTPGASVSTSGTGQYVVKFPSAVNGCAYSATLDSTGESSPFTIGFATVASDSNPDAVDVSTYDVSTSPAIAADSGFDLYVSCN